MNLQEYLKQSEHLSAGSVDVLPSECESIPGTKLVSIPALSSLGVTSYYHVGPLISLPGEDNVLYTTDRDGNPQKPTVFRISQQPR